MAFVGSRNSRVNVSSPSWKTSGITSTGTFFKVSPGAKVSVSETPTKSVSSWAVPSAVAYFTDTSRPLALLSLTSKGISPSLSRALAGAAVSLGAASSSSMVPTAAPSAISALRTFRTAIRNVSSASSSASSVIGTRIFQRRSPGAISKVASRSV